MLFQEFSVSWAWPLHTVLPVYVLIDSGKKTYDTRAPDPLNDSKKFHQALVGDKALVYPVDETTFDIIDCMPVLRYRICDVQKFVPSKGESWEVVVERMLESVGLDSVFPGFSLEEALDAYSGWPSTPRIAREGIVALGLGEKLEE